MSHLEEQRTRIREHTSRRLAAIRRILDEHERETVEFTSPQELCRVAVTLRGRLSDVVFLDPNALRSLDRDSLADEVAAAIRGAQTAASARLAELARVTEN